MLNEPNLKVWHMAFKEKNLEALLTDATKVPNEVAFTKYTSLFRDKIGKSGKKVKNQEIYFGVEESLMTLGLLWCQGTDKEKAHQWLRIVNPKHNA